MIPAPVKQKKCKCGCGAMFSPRSSLQVVATADCAVKMIRNGLSFGAAQKKLGIQRRKEDRARKEAVKPLGKLRAEAQAAFNAYIRARDLKAGHNCICCGLPFGPQRPGGSIDCGHYLSRGSHPNLAFDERNANAQKKNCNRPGGTTAAAFRLGMIERYGLAVVEELESDTTPRRFRAEDYREIRRLYRAKLKELKI